MIFKNAFLFSIAVFISRILGYFRDAIFAYYFGVSYVSDAFFIAWRLPNTLRRLLGEGGLNASFVPIYGELYKKDENLSKEFFASLFWYLVFINLIIVIFIIIFAPFVIRIIAPGITNFLTFTKAVFLLRFLIINQLFFSLNALLMGALNVHNAFFRSAFTQAIFNFSMILCMLLFAKSLGVESAMIGALVGGLSQVLFLYSKAKSLALNVFIKPRYKTYIKEFFKRLLPAMAGFGVAQLSFFVDTFLASMLGKGVISYMYYANRLFQLPLGLMSVGLANALLSSLSLGDDKKLRTSQSFALISVLSLPASFGLFVLSKDIITLLYAHGVFNRKDVINTSHILSILSFSILFFSWQKILSSTFFASKDTTTPTLSTFFGVLTEGISGYIFAFLMHLSFIGLAIGTFISSLVSFSFLLWSSKGAFIDFKIVFHSLTKAMIGSILMASFIFYFKSYIHIVWLKVFIFIPLGAFVYGTCLYILKEPFALMIFKKIAHRL